MMSPEPASATAPCRDVGIDADRELVGRVVANDPEAIREFFVDRFGRALSHLARQYAGGEDETGALLLHLSKDKWQRLRSWKGESRLGTWLNVVAGRFFQQLHRYDHRPVPRLAQAENAMAADDPVVESLRRERRSELVRAVQAIPNKMQRVAVRLRYLKEMAPSDVAKEMGVSRANVDVLLHRARVFLRDYLGRRDDDA